MPPSRTLLAAPWSTWQAPSGLCCAVECAKKGCHHAPRPFYILVSELEIVLAASCTAADVQDLAIKLLYPQYTGASFDAA